jgi:hypothetical protein
MTRSSRYTPIISITKSGLRNGESEDKSIANKKFRRKNKRFIGDALITNNLEEIILINKLEEVSNVYDFIKDGKQYLDKNSENYDHKYMRK